jgi:hypothetical protein
MLDKERESMVHVTVSVPVRSQLSDSSRTHTSRSAQPSWQPWRRSNVSILPRAARMPRRELPQRRRNVTK